MLRIVHIEHQGGTPVQIRGGTITPFSRSVRIQLPGLHGGLIWNRPVSILVQTEQGDEQVIQVIDATRRVQLALLGFTLAVSLLMFAIKRRIRKSLGGDSNV